MKLFLSLKHWQLFVLMFGIPIIFQVFITISSLSSDNDIINFIDSVKSNNNNNSIVIMAYSIPIMVIFFGSFFFGWFYTIGTNLHKKLPPTVQMNLTGFKILLFISVVYIYTISIFILKILSNNVVSLQISPAIIVLIILLHLFSMFCIFYCLYFNAKVLKTVELQKSVKFNDFIGEFFLIWFYPVGIWTIQPRINKLFDKREKYHAGQDL